MTTRSWWCVVDEYGNAHQYLYKTEHAATRDAEGFHSPHRAVELVEKGSEEISEEQREELYEVYAVAVARSRSTEKMTVPGDRLGGVCAVLNVLGLLPEFRERLENEPK